MVEKAIYRIVSSYLGFANVQVSFGTLPNKTFDGDYIVFYRNSTEPYGTKSGRSTLDAVSLQFNIYSHSADQCCLLAETLRGLLDRFSGTTSGIVIQSIEFTNQNNMFDFNEGVNEKGVYQMVQFYSIRTDPEYL